MKFLNTRLKKILFWFFSIVILLVVLVIAFISPLTKWAIEKYDMKYTGREITLDLAYVNPFTGKVYLKNLEVHEAQSDSVFFSTAGLSVNFEMWKLLSKTYEISEFTLHRPVIKIIQNKKEFNFNDLIKKFSPKDSIPKAPKKDPVHFNFLNVKIEEGTFYYTEQTIPVNYFIKQTDIETSGKRWDVDTMAFKFAFVSGIGEGGDMKGDLSLNTATMDYKLAAFVRKFDLSILEQYLKDIANYGKVRGNLDANVRADGNFKNSQNLVASGLVSVNDFHFGKSEKEDYLSFKKASVDIIQLSPKNKKYLFDSIFILNPYFKYERYDHLDNLQDMFGKKGEKAKEAKETGRVNILFQIGNYVADLAKNFFKSQFKVKRLAVYNADFQYNDYSLNEEFSAAVSPLTLLADSIERSDRWVNLHLRTGLKPYGNLAVDLSINPKDSSDFTLKYKLQKVSLAMFNPYFITLTSFPLDRGIVEFHGVAKVNNGVINCNNHLVVIDPRVNNKQKRNGARWLPMRVFMFLVRERGNVIDYEVPIHGDLKDPKFKFGDVITDILENIFVKPVTVPYRVEVKNVENEIEKSLTLKWVMRSAGLNSPQENFIEKIADYLKEHPQESIGVDQELYTAREKEYILFFEAKKKYYLAANHLKGKPDENDSTRIERIPVKDSTFLLYLDAHGGKNLHTVQEKCRQLVSAKEINQQLHKLNEERRQFFLSFFKDGTDKQVHFRAVKDTIPFNGFSQYRLNFKDSLPDEMQKAYEKINELDSNSPRNKFKMERKKDRRLLDIK